MIRWVAAFLFGSCSLCSAAVRSPWGSVESILGRKGVVQGEGFRIDLPRGDLNVKVQGDPLEPGLACPGRINLQPLHRGTLLTGELVLLVGEVAPVTFQLAENGFQVTAVHDFLRNESPAVRMVHFKARGSRANLARALEQVLSRRPLRGIFTVLTPITTEKTPSTTNATTSPRGSTEVWDKIEGVLGPGTARDRVLEYESPAGFPVSEDGIEIPPFMGMETRLRFQRIQGRVAVPKTIWNFWKSGEATRPLAAASGSILLAPEQLDTVEKSFAENHLSVICPLPLHSSPKVFLLYFWARGTPLDIAAGLKEALDQIHRAPP